MRLSGNVFGQAGSNQDTKGKEKQGSGQGHKGSIYCLAASEDGKYVVTGGKDKLVGVWEVQPGSSTPLPRRAKVSAKKRKAKQKAGDGSVKWVRGLLGHKDAVTVSISCRIRKPGWLTMLCRGLSSVGINTSPFQSISPFLVHLFIPSPVPSISLDSLDYRHLLWSPRLNRVRLCHQAHDGCD
jgi:WD40 repeat protein